LDPTVLAPAAASTAETTYLVDHLMQGIYDESTREYANALVLPLCVGLWRANADNILREAAANVELCHLVLPKAWGTRSLVPPALAQGAMACVLLPTERLQRSFARMPLTVLKKYVHDELLSRWQVEVPVFVWRGELAVRVSVPGYILRAHLQARKGSLLSWFLRYSHAANPCSVPAGAGGRGERAERRARRR